MPAGFSSQPEQTVCCSNSTTQVKRFITNTNYFPLTLSDNVDNVDNIDTNTQHYNTQWSDISGLDIDDTDTDCSYTSQVTTTPGSIQMSPLSPRSGPRLQQAPVDATLLNTLTHS